MAETNTPRPIFVLVDNSNKRLFMQNGVITPAFHYAKQAKMFAESMGIHDEAYQIVNVGGK